MCAGTPGLAAPGRRPLPAGLSPAIGALRAAGRTFVSPLRHPAAGVRVPLPIGRRGVSPGDRDALRLGGLPHPRPQPALALEIKLQPGVKAVSLKTLIRLLSA